MTEPSGDEGRVDATHLPIERIEADGQGAEVIRDPRPGHEEGLLAEMTWQWRDGTAWRDFDPGLAAQLDGARDAGQATCVYSFRGQPYEVDFQQGTQVNKNTGFARDVRRVATPEACEAALGQHSLHDTHGG